MKFRYTAKDDRGLTSKGEVEAGSAAAVAGQLREKKLLPMAINEAKDLIDVTSLTKRLARISIGDVANFTRQLATMITAGLPITDALALLKAQAGPAMMPVVGKILEDVQGGLALSEAMGKHPEVFSKVYVALLRAGEAAGVMEKVLVRLADNLEKSREFQSKVKGAMVYPMIVFAGMIAVMVVMMVAVIPRLTSLYKEFGAELPVATQIVVGMSDFMVGYWGLVLVLGGAGFYGLRAYITAPAGRRWWDGMFYRIPVIGTLSQEVMLTELTRTLSLLVGAGVSIVEALNIVADALGNVVVEGEVKRIAKQVEKGFPVSVSFSESEAFPPIVGQMMAVGEETGKMDEVLAKLSGYYESESEQKVKGLTTAIEPLIIILLGLGVGFLIFAVVMPIYNLTSQFS